MGRKKCRCTISPTQATKIAAMMGSGFGLPKDTSPNLPENWLLSLPLRTRKTGSKPAEELTLRQLLEKTMVTKRGLSASLDASSDEISIRTQRGSGACQSCQSAPQAAQEREPETPRTEAPALTLSPESPEGLSDLP